MAEPLDALVRTRQPLHAHAPADASPPFATPQVASIHALSGGTPAEQQQRATQLKGAEESLARAAAGGGAPLAQALAALDHAQHTLAFIYCLCVRSAALATPCFALHTALTRALGVRSDAQGSAAGGSLPALEAFVASATRFLLAASEAQIKLVPDKCAPQKHRSARPSCL